MANFDFDMIFNAAIIKEKNGVFNIEQVKLGKPRSDELIIKVVATGMCHTDMAVRDGVIPMDMPVVLGHEGAGIIVDMGEGVRNFAIGDHVVLSFLPCGFCEPCFNGHPAYCSHFNAYNFAGWRACDCSHALSSATTEKLHDRFFGQSSFAEYALVNQRNIVKVPKDIDLKLLGPLGCGIQTGAGTVLNALKVKEGSSITIFGSGAVGLSAVMAALVAGATTIIIIDINAARLDFGQSLGATHIINSQHDDPVQKIKEICGGTHYAIDTTGIGSVIESAVLSLRSNGIMALVGASKAGTKINLEAGDIMMQNKHIRGVVEGDSVPQLFIPRLIDLYKAGRFPFDKLIKFYDFSDINQAAEDSEKGITLKPVILIGQKV